MAAISALAAAATASAAEPEKPRVRTDGYVAVSGGVRHVQTFKAPSDRIDWINLRLARGPEVPFDNLKVELREPGGAALVSAEVESDNFSTAKGVTRFFRWYNVAVKAAGLTKGKTYELVVSSRTDGCQPWLVNCFYADTYADGQYRLERGGRPAAVGGGGFDLVFDACSEGGRASSVPAGAELQAKEHFGLGHDGKDLLAGTGLRRPPSRTTGTVPTARPRPEQVVTTAPPHRPEVRPETTAVPAPRMTLSRARELVRTQGEALWVLPDPVDSDLSWIAVRGKFVWRHDAGQGDLVGFGDFLRLVGRRGLDVKGLAFGRDFVWAATDRGAFVYDRRGRFWSQLAVNRDFDLIDAPVERVWLTRTVVSFALRGRGTYEFDLETGKWSVAGRSDIARVR